VNVWWWPPDWAPQNNIVCDAREERVTDIAQEDSSCKAISDVAPRHAARRDVKQPQRVVTGAHCRVVEHGEVVAGVDLRPASWCRHGLHVGEGRVSFYARVLQDHVGAVLKDASAVAKPTHALEANVVSVAQVERLPPVLDLDAHDCVVASNVVPIPLELTIWPAGNLETPRVGRSAGDVWTRVSAPPTGKVYLETFARVGQMRRSNISIRTRPGVSFDQLVTSTHVGLDASTQDQTKSTTSYNSASEKPVQRARHD
jgi:hypothetical protein